MSGPPYPRPGAGIPNGIGQFIIGVSPIGDVPPFDIWRTVISQYANSPRLTQIIDSMDAALDLTFPIEEFFDDIFNIETATGYGLDVWGRRIGVSRTLHVPVGDYIGFAQALPTAETFGYGALYSGAPVTDNFNLTDSVYRQLLFARAAANISDCSIKDLNQILLSLFPNRGNCYVTDGEDMSMTYTFKFALSPAELAVVSQSGALPKPTGVSLSVVVDA